MRLTDPAAVSRLSLCGAVLLLGLCAPLTLRAAQHEGHQGGQQPKHHQHAPQSQRPDHHEMMDDVRQLHGLRGAKLERAFLTMMQDHHQSGIDMARMALGKLQNPKLRRLAQKMVSDQTRENQQMRTYLSRWHGMNRNPKPDPRMQDTMEKMGRLSGAAFDRAFVTEMSHHHEGAIQMSEPVRRRAPHAQVRRLATQIMTSQRKEQQEMRRALRNT